MIKPTPLKERDAIGIVAPGSPVNPELFSKGVNILEDMGFRVVYGKFVLERNGYLAGSDIQRLADLNMMVMDEYIKAIIAARGGFGCLRLLEGLNLNEFKLHPKLVIGFSDCTSLLNIVSQRSSLITLHGPVVTQLSTISEESRASLRSMLTMAEYPPISMNSAHLVRRASVSGRLAGGNLTTLCHLIGTPFEPDFSESILILEDTNEPCYRIDRMFTHMKLAGKFDKVKGFLLGSFLGVSEIEAVWDRVLELCPDNSVPVWGNMPIGHGDNNYTWPIGAKVELDKSGLIRFLNES